MYVCEGGLIFQRHSEKTGSSFQTPVQAKEWVSSVEESDRVESSVFCCFLFFKYSIVRKSPHLLSLSYLMLSLPTGRLVYGDGREVVGGGGAMALPPTPLIIAHATAEPQANPENRVVDRSPQKSSFPKKGTTKSKLKHLNKKFFFNSPSSMRAAMSE